MLMKVYLWFRKNILKIDDRSQLEIAIENGLKIGKNHNIQNQVIFDWSHCWLIEIGDNVTIAPRTYILCHDASTKNALGYTKIGRVRIGNNVFIGANTTILPGVTIGDNVIIRANSVVTKDIPENSVAIGNPCRVIKDYNNYVDENKKIMDNVPVFDEKYIIGNIDEKRKEEMIEKLDSTNGFVK